jgi:hypothetical protein
LCCRYVEDAAQTATAVEQAMYIKWTETGKEYKAKFRQLAFNLKDAKNPDLRWNVADGLISPAVLLDLSPEELASDERRGNNAKIREAATDEVGLSRPPPPRPPPPFFLLLLLPSFSSSSSLLSPPPPPLPLSPSRQVESS